jgi:hypothetical protein
MFSDAIQYLDKYRKDRGEALNNAKRMRWSTSDVSDLKSLQATFSSTQENSDWQTSYDASKAAMKEVKADPDQNSSKRQAQQMKIAFLAGCRRDLRILFISGIDDMRTPIDWDRYEFMKVEFYRQKLALLKQAVQAREGKPGGK